MNEKELINFLQISKTKLNMNPSIQINHVIITCALEAACDNGYTDEVDHIAEAMHIDWDPYFDDYPTDNTSRETDKLFIRNLIKIIKKESYH